MKKTRKKTLLAVRILQHILYTCIILFMLAFLIAGGLSHVKKEKRIQHTPVNAADLKVTTKELEEKTYDISYTTGKMIDNVQYYNVEIGPVQTTMPADEYKEKFESNDKITTSIYVFTAQNTQKYLFKKSKGDTVQSIRLSYLGEEMFTEEEVLELTDWAAKALTDVKYEVLGDKKAQLPSFFTLEGGWF